MSKVRSVSVIAPMRDEAEHVEDFVADLAAQDFEGPVEVLVADGGSTDGSPELLREAAATAGLDLHLIANPAGQVSPGLNRCVASANGDLIIRFDCHSRYPTNYLRFCALASEETGAWNVGGRCIPEGRTALERAVACAMDSPFGGIGWTRMAGVGRRVETDTVTYGAFRPAAFKAAGLFDETLVRNQDDEFNLRLRSAGGKVVLDPAIVVKYIPRGSLRAVWRQYYEYGLWKVPVMIKHRQVLGLRSLVPIGLVASFTGFACGAVFSKRARALLAVELIGYTSGALGFGSLTVRRHDESVALLPLVVTVFPAFHLGYGSGMARGWLRAIVQACRKVGALTGGVLPTVSQSKRAPWP